MRRALIAFLLLTLMIPALARRRSVQLPEDPRDVPVEAVLTSTRSQADLDGDGRKEMLVLVNALTGREEVAAATEVILGVTAPDAGEERGALLWVRHVAKETAEPAHNGELTAVDLDGDGASELVLTWDRSLSATRTDRWAEVYAIDEPARPRRIWEGIWERDTRRDESVPEAEREWFERDIDYGATRRAAGRALLISTRRHVIAGHALAEPRVLVERFEARLRP